MQGLVRKELIRPHPATLGADEAFRFRHLLIRDAAYDGLPKATRADLHERFARWMEAAAVDLPELDEIAGWHLEQAVRYRHESDAKCSRRWRSAPRHTFMPLAGGQAPAATPGGVEPARAGLGAHLRHADIHVRIAVDLAEELVEEGKLARVDQLLSIAEQDPDTASDAVPVRLRWLLMSQPRRRQRRRLKLGLVGCSSD